MHLANIFNYKELVNYLISKGANKELKNKRGHSPLEESVDGPDEASVASEFAEFVLSGVCTCPSPSPSIESSRVSVGLVDDVIKSTDSAFAPTFSSEPEFPPSLV
mmetsp:Transcript_42222/g.133019  ORF Transcript_42222/g.133019 Transcript_42222/m.133019 type:complete len:105 (-) Transcript_42222:1729-2043(-)